MAQVSVARKAAFDILLAMEQRRVHSDHLLRDQPVIMAFSGDRHLVFALVFGVLRWQIALDARIRPLLKRPNAKVDPEVLIALRLGAFQLAHMDRIPAHAAIDESVELTRQSGHRFASGMVNAVLRKFALAPQVEPSPESAYPAWLIDRWTRNFGAEAAHAICRHGQSQPAQAVRFDDPQTESELAQAGLVFTPGALLQAARIVVSGETIGLTPAFLAGRVRIQDEGSQLVAEIAGCAGQSQPGAILDCCAAPGGKTLILAERNPHARIVACEVNPSRHEKLSERMSPLEDRVECRLADVTALSCENEFGLVLVDAPCSGTGTLGRNPEIRHRLTEDEFARQAEKQKAILSSALRAARAGARVVYSTCSLEPEENEQIIDAILREHTTARLIPMPARIRELQAQGVLADGAAEKLTGCITPEGYLRLMPGELGTDGFFVALLQKVVTPA